MNLLAFMVPFYCLCAGIAIGVFVPQFLVWYERRQEQRWEEMRAAIPPTRAYPRQIIEFKPATRKTSAK